MSRITGYYCLINETDADRSASGHEKLRRAAGALRPDAHDCEICEEGGVGMTQTGDAMRLLQYRKSERECILAFDGELYNTAELRAVLASRGCACEGESEAETLLAGLLQEGTAFLQELNGVFALAFWDGERLLLARDRLGAKPLYYATEDGYLYFGSEPKALFAMGFRPALDDGGLRELFALGPAHTPGNGIFKGLHEVLPAQWISVSPGGMRSGVYWRLQSLPHRHDERETVEAAAFLVRDAIERQTDCDAPICAFLSGGLDSSLVSAVSARKLRAQGKCLKTFSFDFTGNDDYYKATNFQPSRDAPFADEMAAFLHTEHTRLECDPLALADLLEDAMQARDYPGMADVDASLLYFCKKVGRQRGIALTGECADEVFGGYPWFRSREAFEQQKFPWSDMRARRSFLREDVLERLELDVYAQVAYDESVAETPRCAQDSPEEARRREIAWLNLRWFMQTLMDRMDRCAESAGLSARVPFADHRLVEYVWNIPWPLKYKDNTVKYILRRAGEGWLPDSVLYRAKSPFPKTYHPGYEALLAERMRDLLASPNEPMHRYVDKKKAEAFLSAPADYGKPWYGQLMAAPQRIAWFLQLNAWLKRYF